MSSSNRMRWREKRETLPARRHRRRRRRRDLERSESYEPAPVDPDSASRGVQKRLLGAVLAVALTAVCIGTGLVVPLGSFAATFAFTLGLSSFGAGLALILSARHEECVHEFAARLDDGAFDSLPPAEEPPGDETSACGTDGSVADSGDLH